MSQCLFICLDINECEMMLFIGLDINECEMIRRSVFISLDIMSLR